jgi:FkbM family methyltransferase
MNSLAVLLKRIFSQSIKPQSRHDAANQGRSLSYPPPEGLRFHKMKDAKRMLSYFLAFSEAHSDYESLFEKLGGPEANVQLIINLLGGVGTLVDVGANIGTVAVPVAASGSSVVAIEMNPVNCLKLWAAAAANGFQNFHIVQAAAGDHDGVMSFQGQEAWGQVRAAKVGTPCVYLQVDTIMSQFKGVPDPMIIKVDVEGHEAAVFRGATETLRRHRPIVLFESIEIEGEHNLGRKSKSILAEAGYDLFLCRGSVLCPKKVGEIQEGHVTDFLAVQRDDRAILAKNGAQVRQFTDKERIAWVREMAAFDHINHKRHAAGVLLRWGREKPGLAKQAAPIISNLLAYEPLGALHDALRQLMLR